jgi:CheY-like chemotaxis protein/HPt (histidine-containing phosphotransfer) domain-containing protein
LLLGTQLSDKQRRFVQAVYRSGESLLEIINDILDFSKIEAGKLELASIDFVLRGVVEDTLELLAPRAHEKGLELSFREEPGLPIVVKGDPLRLRQVLTNLVVNAIKFTGQGDVVVTLGVPVLLSSISAPDDVRAAHQAGFHRFVPKPIRKAELRQAILGISATIPEASRLTPRLNAHILVVEDNVVNQEVIGQMLRTLGCRVQVSTGALAGLRAMCEKPFDLVLMDIQMPGMDGVEALNWFRRGTAGRFNFLTSADTPIIAVTANALGGDEERFLGLGFDDYLSKPFRQSQLLAMLTKHLRPAAPATPGDAGAAGGSSPSALRDAEFDSTVLDAQALERLRELDPNGENRLMERVVNAFESSIGRLMPQLQDALDGSEFGGIRHVAHTLKSSSASIGAMKLSRMCTDVESRARHEQSEGMNERIVQLQAEVEIVRAALKRILG